MLSWWQSEQVEGQQTQIYYLATSKVPWIWQSLVVAPAAVPIAIISIPACAPVTISVPVIPVTISTTVVAVAAVPTVPVPLAAATVAIPVAAAAVAVATTTVAAATAVPACTAVSVSVPVIPVAVSTTIVAIATAFAARTVSVSIAAFSTCVVAFAIRRSLTCRSAGSGRGPFAEVHLPYCGYARSRTRHTDNGWFDLP
jgi:hypothetical protein